jgi:hypothetical protein
MKLNGALYVLIPPINRHPLHWRVARALAAQPSYNLP